MNHDNLKTHLVILITVFISCVFRYLCKLTDKDLRQPDGRIMVDSMWSAVKGPVESGPICDKYENNSCVVVQEVLM